MDMSIMPEGLFINSAKTCALQGFWMSRTSGVDFTKGLSPDLDLN